MKDSAIDLGAYEYLDGFNIFPAIYSFLFKTKELVLYSR